MRRLLFALVSAALMGVPGFLWASPNFSFGANIEYFHPQDADLYGQTMADNSWGSDIAGIASSSGKDRNAFYTFNKYDGILSPGLTQSLIWDFGLSLELAERWQWLIWAPNKDVDIVFDRTVVPVTLTAKYSFLPTHSWHPTAGAGLGVSYFYTHIYGDDLYDQHRNADFPDEGLAPEASPAIPTPREFFRDKREFRQTDFFFEYHLAAGIDFDLTDRLGLSVGFRWSVVPAESIEIVRVREGNIDDWHWKEGKIKGDAGGYSGTIGVSYLFLR